MLCYFWGTPSTIEKKVMHLKDQSRKITMIIYTCPWSLLAFLKSDHQPLWKDQKITSNLSISETISFLGHNLLSFNWVSIWQAGFGDLVENTSPDEVSWFLNAVTPWQVTVTAPLPLGRCLISSPQSQLKANSLQILILAFYFICIR